MNDLYHQLQLYAAQLWRKRWYIVLVAYLLCVGGWVTVTSLPDRYESQARIYVDTESLLSPLLRGISVEGNVTQQVDYMQRTLLSRPNLEKLIRMSDLDLLINSQAEKDRFLEALAKRVGIQGGSGAGRNLFTVRFTDERPEVTQRVVQSLLSIFVESNVGQSRSDIEKARQFLDSQITEYEKQLQAAEARLASYKKSNLEFLGNTTTSFTHRLDTMRQQRQELLIQVDDARSRRGSLRRDLEKTPQLLEVDALQQNQIIIGDRGEPMTAALANLQTRVQETEKGLDQMLLRYTEQHPDVMAAKKQLASLKQQYEQEKKTAEAAPPPRRPVGATGAAKKHSLPNPLYEQIRVRLVDAEANAEMLERRLANMDKELSRLEGYAARAPQIEAEFATLNRDYGVLKKNYDDLTSRRESARIADAVETKGEKIQFRIVDPPQVPTLPSGPPRLILMSAVLVASLGAGVVVAFLMSQLDDSFVSLSRLKETVAIPVLGSVTLVQTASDRRLKLLGTVSFAASIAILVMAYGYLALVTLRTPLPFI